MTDRYPTSIKIGDRPLHEAVAFCAGIINNNVSVGHFGRTMDLLNQAIRARRIDEEESNLRYCVTLPETVPGSNLPVIRSVVILTLWEFELPMDHWLAEDIAMMATIELSEMKLRYPVANTTVPRTGDRKAKDEARSIWATSYIKSMLEIERRVCEWQDKRKAEM